MNSNGRRHGWLNRLIAAPFWGVVILVAALQAGGYLMPADLRSSSRHFLMASWVELFAGWFRPHLAVACLACALAGLFLRRGRLAFLGLIIALTGFAPVLREWMPRNDSASVAGTSLKLASMNLQGENRDGAAIVAQIRAADPDVLLIQEFTPFQQEVLEKSLAGDYPQRLLFPHGGYDGMAIYSRLPLKLESPPIINTPGWPTRIVKSVLHVGDRDIALWSVHLMAVTTVEQVERNRYETADLIAAVRNESRPLIVAGDFNFTNTTANAEALESTGLTDTARLAGQGRRPTWPSSGWHARLGIRIDHFYVTPQFRCTEDHVGGETGSDHLPIAATLVLTN